MKNPVTRSRALVARYMRPHWLLLLLLSAALITGIVLQLLAPLILRSFIDAVTGATGGPAPPLARYALLFIVVSVSAQLAAVVETYLAERVGWSATNALRADVALHCLRQDLPFHHTHTSGELIERIDGDISILANFFSRFVSAVVGHGLYLVGMLIVLCSIDWRIGLALAGFTIVAVALLSYLQGVGQPYFAAYRQTSAGLMGFVAERWSATEDLRANGAVGYALDQLHGWLRALFRREAVSLLMASSMMWAATAMLISAGTALVFLLSASFFERGLITIGTAYLIYSYTQQLMHPLGRLAEQMQDFQQAGVALTRVGDLLALEPTRQPVADGALPAGGLTLEFRDVCFAYAADQPALEGVSFRLAAGRSLGLLGRTGSGKTTLARLLVRLYEPSAGTICVGGVDIATLPLPELRRRLVLVTQDVHLFHASVRDNITVFQPDIPDEQIERALADLGLRAWFQRLPQGLDTMLSSAGSLSAGEAQLLALTRVFLLDPRIVILDEASSRLDPATELLIDRAVQRLLYGRTSVIIAHRLSTVQRVDQILILEDGRVREYGAREQLAADPQSRLFALMQAQPEPR